MAGQSLVSDLIISRIYNIIAVIYGATIKDDNGQVLEALVGIRDGTGLSSNFDTLGFGEGGWAFIFDQDGTVFALLCQSTLKLRNTFLVKFHLRQLRNKQQSEK